MSLFSPTDLYGTVTGLFVNGDVDTSLVGQETERVRAEFSGFEGEGHGGLTRPACVRVKKQYPLGTEIRNARQVSIVSTEELEQIAADMDLPGPIHATWLGANLQIEGIPEFTTIPASSRLVFDSGASIVVDCENGPCRGPAEVIEQHYPGKGNRFVKHALHRRGIVGWIEAPGLIERGARCRLHVPPLRTYKPLQG